MPAVSSLPDQPRTFSNRPVSPQSQAFNLGLGASAIHFLANFVNLYV
jgi:hypothetical protein